MLLLPSQPDSIYLPTYIVYPLVRLHALCVRDAGSRRVPTRLRPPVRALYRVRGGAVRESRVSGLWRGQNMRDLPNVRFEGVPAVCSRSRPFFRARLFAAFLVKIDRIFAPFGFDRPSSRIVRKEQPCCLVYYCRCPTKTCIPAPW